MSTLKADGTNNVFGKIRKCSKAKYFLTSLGKTGYKRFLNLFYAIPESRLSSVDTTVSTDGV